LQEFYQEEFRRKLYLSLGELKIDLDARLGYYNNELTHQGKMCCGRTPLQTLIAGKGGLERESHQPEFNLTIRHRQNGELSDQVATSTAHSGHPVGLGMLIFWIPFRA
jgi:hypothetical protein